jgi:hypothetical protein
VPSISSHRLLPLSLLFLACHGGQLSSFSGSDSPEGRFWATLETARAASHSCSGLARALTTALRVRPPSQIAEFDTELQRRLIESYRWDLWAVAYVANGGSSDDGFEYFRGWLLTQGHATYTRALEDPPSAVRWTLPWTILECEDILGAPYDAYVAVAGAAPSQDRLPYPPEPAGRRWTEDSLRLIYPGMVPRVKRWRWLYAWGL